MKSPILIIKGEKAMYNRQADQVWDSRAAVLVASMRPFLTWAREHKGARIDEGTFRRLLSLSSLATVLSERILPVQGPDGETCPVDLEGMPEDAFAALADYLEGTPGWDRKRCSESTLHDTVQWQHMFVLQSVEPHLSALSL